MKPEEIEICRSAFDFYGKGVGIGAGYFEKLKQVIPKSITKQIKASSRFILLIGENEDLMMGVVAYILHQHYGNKLPDRLYYHSFAFKNGEKIQKELYATGWSKDIVNVSHYTLSEWYFNRVPIFFKGWEDNRTLEKYAEEARDRSMRVVHDPSHQPGTLIVSKKSADGLSEAFRRQFDIIRLEPKKTWFGYILEEYVILKPAIYGMGINLGKIIKDCILKCSSRK